MSRLMAAAQNQKKYSEQEYVVESQVIPKNGSISQKVLVEGVSVNDFAIASYSGKLDDVILFPQVTSADTVTVKFINPRNKDIKIGIGKLCVLVVANKEGQHLESLIAQKSFNSVESSMGQAGGKYISSTDATTPATGYVFVAVQALEDTVLTAVGNITGITGVALGQGQVLYGRYTSITLASGSVVAYNGL